MFYTYTAPFGPIAVAIEDDALCSVNLLPERLASLYPALPLHIALEFDAYFKNPHHRWQLSLNIKGTAFQTKLWAALQQIPVGKTLSYGDLAAQLKSHPRAVGQACRANPLALVIPCHRVLAKQAVGGFMGNETGPAITIKNYLLNHEQANH
jgi:methylated-DNA-[protein]-cysteine S-methyltransferase